MILRRLTLMLLLWSMASASLAEFVVAQVSPQTRPLAANGQANHVGAKAYFEQINAQGGVNGRRIRFVLEDDQYKPEETIRLVRSVAQRDRPIAFLNLLGSANVAALLKDQTLEQLRIPAVGITPGSDVLRTPGSPWMFHVTASDNAQLSRIISHVATVGLRRVAVVYQDLPFGTSGLAHAEAEASSANVTIAARVAVPPGAGDLKAAAQQLKSSGAQVYVMVLAPNSSVGLVRDVRAAGDTTPIYGMSALPVQGLIDVASPQAAVGIGLAQVTPNPSSTASGLIREFHATMRHYAPGTEPSQLHLVGYLAARVTVEALRRAGPSSSADRLSHALRQLKIDLGGYQVDFTGSSNNVGSKYVDIGVVGRNGRLMY